MNLEEEKRGGYREEVLIPMAMIIVISSLFCIFKNYNKPLVILICLELILIALAIVLLDFTISYDDLYAYLTAFLLLVISATEASLGLTLILISRAHSIFPISSSKHFPTYGGLYN